MTTQQPETTPSCEAFASQLQVFASAWAIVGGLFDAGDGMQTADGERAIVLDMWRRLHAENEQLRAGYDAARQEIESLKAKNLELERVCDATYVTQGADAYNHACSMMEQYQAERKAARKEVGTERSLCDGISWLYTRIASLESQLEDVGTGGDVQPYDQQAMGLCHVCGWKGVIDYPDGPVCVACEHDKTLSPQPTAPAQNDAKDAALWRALQSIPKVDKLLWQYVLSDEMRDGHDSVEQALGAITSQQGGLT